MARASTPIECPFSTCSFSAVEAFQSIMVASDEPDISRLRPGSGTYRTHFTKSVCPRKRRPGWRVEMSQDQIVLSQLPA